MSPENVEDALLPLLKELASHPAARGLKDDAAVYPWPVGLELVATHDMLAEGVHFTASCPPASIGWKTVAVNYSDLAACGARPVALLLGAGIGAGRNPEWAQAFLKGVGAAIGRFGGALIGGDTVRLKGPSVFGVTALGSVPAGEALGRMDASAGEDLWVSGTIGDAGLGLAALGRGEEAGFLVQRYRRPTPRMTLGVGLRQVATAMMDVSDGLFLDASRLAAASGVAVTLDCSAIPRSEAARASGQPAVELATFGDDYELLFAAPESARDRVLAIGREVHVALTRIGRLHAGEGLSLAGADAPFSPEHLGYKHV